MKSKQFFEDREGNFVPQNEQFIITAIQENNEYIEIKQLTDDTLYYINMEDCHNLEPVKLNYFVSLCFFFFHDINPQRGGGVYSLQKVVTHRGVQHTHLLNT